MIKLNVTELTIRDSSKSLHVIFLQKIDVSTQDHSSAPTYNVRLNLRQRSLVKITGCICIAAYIATITVFVTHCHPINRLWQVFPYPGDDCALNISKYLALVVTNVA